MKMRKREAHLREKEAKRERKPKKSCLSFRNIFARSEQNIVEANGLWFTPALHLLIGMQNSAAQPSLFTFSQLTPLWLATWEEKKRKFSCSTTSKSPKDHSIRSLKSEMQQRETKFEPIALKLKWCQLLSISFSTFLSPLYLSVSLFSQPFWIRYLGVVLGSWLYSIQAWVHLFQSLCIFLFLPLVSRCSYLSSYLSASLFPLSS